MCLESYVQLVLEILKGSCVSFNNECLLALLEHITTTPAVLNVFAVADAVSQYLAASTGLHQAMAMIHFCVSSHRFHDKKRICSAIIIILVLSVIIIST